MKPKTTTILYWICTLMFSGLMIFSAAGGIGPSEQAIDFMHKTLGYPVYFIQLISWAKIAGAVIILIPGLNRVKEWAYAWLFIDLAGAIYSNVAVAGKFDPMMITLLIWIIPGVVSYVIWTRKKAPAR